MKKKHVKTKLTLKVKDLSTLSDQSSKKIEGGAATAGILCTGTCASNKASYCGRDQQTRCLPVP